jgi:dsDNA-specific endonuclease/ATPase MutS2
LWAAWDEAAFREANFARSIQAVFGNTPIEDSPEVVLKMPDRKGIVVVEAKGFRLQVETSRVFKPTVQKRIIKTGDSGHRPDEQASWSLQAAETPATDGARRCDLRGLTVEDALDRASQLLDKGFREQTPRMILIHGLGKGILRDAIRQSLSGGPYPVSFRPGRPEEGGDGVTVVEFEPAGFPSR